jgi:methylenetetrahydrofolate dehydrogenase (NADP+)/methenyltetrahydrofolate cyclohydrolase
MILLDGKKVSKDIKDSLKQEVSDIIKQNKRAPHLAIVLVGEVMASQIYVKNKIKACEYTGIKATLIKKEETVTNEELVLLVNELNNDDEIDGIIVQLPLPKHIDEQLIINTISSKKDVDGFGIENKGKLFSGLECFKSATPFGIIKLLEAYNIDITGMNAVVVGRSNIVGKPMSIMLLDKNATVTICHSRTKDLKEVTKRADILVVAIGKPKFITKEYVKEGATVIDVGIHRNEDNKLCGDVDFDDVKDIVGAITPVPGGVGPMTIAMLMSNCVKSIEL